MTLWKYERWANTEWLKVLPEFKNREEAERIFRHIIGCYADWAMDLDSDLQFTEEDIVIPDSMDQLCCFWEGVSARWPLLQTVEAIESGHLTIGEIVQHVLNHSSYHRGQLRGLAWCEGWNGFPETDFARWALRHRS